MKRRVVILSEAEEELVEAKSWYDKQRFGLGDEFLASIHETISRLLREPVASVRVPGITDPKIRRLLVERFPYSVVFIKHREEL